MVIMWPFIQMFLDIIAFRSIVNGETKTSSVKNWKTIECLAETYPYIIALLNSNKQYTCTGFVIDKRIALTSGNCISPKPSYVVVGASVYSQKTNKHNIFKVSYTLIHSDYNFDLRADDPNGTKIHSNIGLVFVFRPILEVFIPAADTEEFYATELKGKKLNVIGYGQLNNYSDVVVLQQQAYYQVPCSNPKWYYCICGLEYLSYEETYVQNFGQGAPVLFDGKVIGISGIPCGTLTLRAKGMKYNIFTVLAPYLHWVQINGLNITIVPRATANASAITMLDYIVNILIFVTMLFFSKVFP